jgi:DNA-binding transcriptional LysR family regulator
MTDLNAMALFVRVVEAGNMSAAARLLGLPKSTISRRIALLEHALNATLLHRSTRSLGLTDTGRIYYERARPIVLEAQQAELEIRSRHARAVGTVRISATTGFGLKVLAPVICDLLRAEPELRIDLRLTDERLNVIEDGLDLAIRMGALDDAELLSRRLTMVKRVLCASPDYLDANGTPDTPAALTRHSCIVTSAALNRWRFEDQTETLVPWRLSAGNVLLACDATLGGHGIALLPQFLAEEHLATGKLRPVLSDFPLPRSEVTALYPKDRILSQATKTVIESLINALARKEL